MNSKENLTEVNILLDRNKVLDEAIFLALCGLDQCRDGLKITGVVRLEIARNMLDKAIKHINDEIDNYGTH